MARVYIGLGANLGEPVENLKAALKLINESPDLAVTKASSVYLTEPVGYEDQPWFYNCVAEIQTNQTPVRLLETLQGIENELGRVRDIRWGPRTVDLDILLYDEIQIGEQHLTIPHPRMKERAFVIVPLAEIAPGARFPDGETVEVVRRRLRTTEKKILLHSSENMIKL